jgi:hypothetical protein
MWMALLTKIARKSLYFLHQWLTIAKKQATSPKIDQIMWQQHHLGSYSRRNH